MTPEPSQPNVPSSPANREEAAYLLARRFLSIMADVLPRASAEVVARAASAPSDEAFLRAVLDVVEAQPSAAGVEVGNLPDGSAAADTAESIRRLDRVVSRAVEALGDPKRAGAWLVSPVRALGGKTPVTLLGTEEGVQEVLAVLVRIEHGVVG